MLKPSTIKGPILVAEDSPNDLYLLEYAARHARLSTSLAPVMDGAEAISYLKGEGRFADRYKHPFPRLALLDLKMPLVTGLEVLAWIRKQRSLATFPVLMFSSSGQHRDIEEAYRLGAQAYITKPHIPPDLIRVLKLVEKYWVRMDAPPPNCQEWLSIVQQPQLQS